MIAQLLRKFFGIGPSKKPRHALCCILRIEISNRHKLADAMEPHDFVSLMSAFYTQFEQEAIKHGAQFRADDVGSWVAAIEFAAGADCVQKGCGLALVILDFSRQISRRLVPLGMTLVPTIAIHYGKVLLSEMDGPLGILGESVNDVSRLLLIAQSRNLDFALSAAAAPEAKAHFSLEEHIVPEAKEGLGPTSFFTLRNDKAG